MSSCAAFATADVQSTGEIEGVNVELVDDSPFFAPTTTSAVDVLFGQYASLRARISDVATAVAGDFGGAMHYFLEGNSQDRFSPSVDRLFQEKGAIAALNSAFWSKALSLTDVYDCMPQKRRDEWNTAMRERKAPEFTEDAVRSTIGELLNSRATFLAERVDGIFRGLSSEHVTNVPEGFGKRMIVGYMLSYGSISSSRAGLINDLRCVIARFMGRDEPKYGASSAMLNALYRCTGQWTSIDGGALRIRVYKKGTAHIEVHPDMAWRLNCVLAQLYPLAIPAQFRTKQPKRPKEFEMMGRPLPFAVLEILTQRHRSKDACVVDLAHSARDNKSAYAEAVRVLEAIGGTQTEVTRFAFDYAPEEVLTEIIVSGCIPDQKAHQFYPTPKTLAVAAIDLAGIGDTHTVLEPSAGQGGIADLLPKERTTCVEISSLHCAILKSKGHTAIEADFLAWAATAPKFDRIVMNPPFSEGRWLAHIEHAFALLAPAGRLVAVLPASARDKNLLAGVTEWSPVIDNAFAGTSVSVVVMATTKGLQ